MPITPGIRLLGAALASATPTTKPRESSSGPPLLPCWMLAVVIRYSPISVPSGSLRGTLSAVAITLKIPVLTKLGILRGVPIAVSFCPGRETVLSFDALWLARPNRVLALPVGVGTVVPVAPVLADDATLHRSLHLIFEVAAMSGRLSLLDSAQTLGIPPRSLQRRLAQMDSTFETLVEEWRSARAIVLLTGDMPIQHIAARLGYSHPAHFTRAFHRWHGMAPARYRDRLGPRLA